MPIDKSLVQAKNGNPAQTYHPASQSYQESHGSNNAPHMKVTDTNGVPIDPRQVDNATLEAKIDALNTKLDSIGGTVGVNNFPTTQEIQVTGSNVGQSLLYDALVITDTVWHISDAYSTKGGKYQLVVNSTLDQTVKIFLRSLGSGVKHYMNGAFETTKIDIPSNTGTSLIITEDEFKPFKGALEEIQLNCICDIAPTTGSLTVKVVEVY